MLRSSWMRGVVMTIALSVVVLSGCTSREEFFADSGLFGEHQLSKIRHQQDLKGSLVGSFFLGCGDVTGSLQINNAIQFSWQPKPGEVVITMLPYNKIKFVIDLSKDIPTVEFCFSNAWKNGSMVGLFESAKFHEAELINLNRIVQSDNLSVAIVRISQETMEQEIYLPQI